MEYAARGEGPPVLVAHGGPGGYDQALVLGELFRKCGFRIIAPSRPGYLGTPLKFGKTAGEQGDLMAALLEALGIPSALMLGASGGGPAGYQLAQRHPGKVKALMVIDGIAMNYSKADDINAAEKWMYLSRSGQWLMGFFFKHCPAAVVKSFLRTESTLEKHELGQRVKDIVKDPNKFALIDAMFKTMIGRFQQRQAGADNDVPPRDAEYAHGAIAGSDLPWINQASHIGFWAAGDAYKVQQYAVDWLGGH